MATSLSIYEEQLVRMGIHFLECARFHEMALKDLSENYHRYPEKSCCENCHRPGNMIYVRPLKEDGLNADYLLGLEAIVCCHLYDYVRGLPRSFWVAEAELVGCIRTPTSGYTFSHSTHKNTGASDVKTSRVKGKGNREEDDTPSFSDFLKNR